MLVLNFERGRGAMLFDPDGRPLGRIILARRRNRDQVAVGFCGFEGIRIMRDQHVEATVQATLAGEAARVH